jgi:hypothetical protein
VRTTSSPEEDEVAANPRRRESPRLRSRVRVQAADPAHDQPGGDMLGAAAAGERGEGGLGDLAVGDQAWLVVVPDRVGVVDRGVGAENPVTSCGLHVLVYEAAESIPA